MRRSFFPAGKKTTLVLLAIIFLASFLRFYRISSVPPSLSWDEASIGYSAYSILKTGKDEWGQRFPLFFKSFGEYKHPFHIYFTAVSEALFGVNEFSVRFGSALFGVINVLLLFFLTFILFKNNSIALLSSFFLAISPWHIQFSRVNWETNFALFFFFLAFIFFIRWLETKKWLYFSLFLFFFFLDIFTYNSPKIFVPVFVFLIPIIFWRKINYRKSFIFAYALFSVFLVFVIYLVFSSFIYSRYSQLVQEIPMVVSTTSYRLTHIYRLGWLELLLRQYLSHFSPNFLFIKGDPIPRHSTGVFGELFIYDILFLPLGIIFLLRKKSFRLKYLLLLWFLLWPVPASIVREYPHASRAMFGLGILQTISALGVYYFMKVFNNNFAKSSLSFLFGLLIFFCLGKYIYEYFYNYPKKSSQAWQYGYKQVSDFVAKNYENYDKIYVTREYGEPQIFLLFYMKYPPEKYQNDTNLVRRKEGDWEVVRSFDKFVFFDKGKLGEVLKTGVSNNRNLFVLGSDDVPDGFSVEETIYFLDGKKAFSLFSSGSL